MEKQANRSDSAILGPSACELNQITYLKLPWGHCLITQVTPWNSVLMKTVTFLGTQVMLQQENSVYV